MDINQTEETKVKKSPYADSPYECSWSAPQAEPQDPAAEPAPEPVPAPQPKKGKRVLNALALIVLSSLVTAFAVSTIWQGRMDIMEQAMNEKFAALKQIYTETQQQNATALPQEGPLTPGQVYAKNVQAVVAVDATYEGANGYTESGGSGFLISADGYVVTNYHVVEGAKKVTVTTYAEQTLTAKVVGYDSANDVALLKIEGQNFPYVTLGKSATLAVGDQVSAIGNPLGELTATLTVGYISAKDRVVSSDGTAINMLQTDAAINPGNSGGPLFNTSGEVVGIITAKYSGNLESGATIEGLGFAIPVDDVTGILSDLQKYGYVTGAYLGVYVRDVDEVAQSYGLPAGAYVQEPSKGYCAEKAGIQAGDIIVNVGGYDVDSVNALTRTLRRFKAGDTVTVTVYRNGERVYLSVTLDEKPAPQPTTDIPINENPNSSGILDIFGDLFPFLG